MVTSRGDNCRSRSISIVAGLIDIFGFLSVLLRGLTLSLEALTIGGVVFAMCIHQAGSRSRMLTCFAGALAATQSCNVALTGSVLAGTVDVSWSEIAGADFFVA